MPGLFNALLGSTAALLGTDTTERVITQPGVGNSPSQMNAHQVRMRNKRRALRKVGNASRKRNRW